MILQPSPEFISFLASYKERFSPSVVSLPPTQKNRDETNAQESSELKGACFKCLNVCIYSSGSIQKTWLSLYTRRKKFLNATGWPFYLGVCCLQSVRQIVETNAVKLRSVCGMSNEVKSLKCSVCLNKF